MIASVTTTVSTIVSSSSAVALFASLGFAGTTTLICSLLIKELASGGGLRLRLLGRNLDIVIITVLFVFSFIVSMKAWEILAS